MDLYCLVNFVFKTWKRIFLILQSIHCIKLTLMLSSSHLCNMKGLKKSFEAVSLENVFLFSSSGKARPNIALVPPQVLTWEPHRRAAGRASQPRQPCSHRRPRPRGIWLRTDTGSATAWAISQHFDFTFHGFKLSVVGFIACLHYDKNCSSVKHVLLMWKRLFLPSSWIEKWAFPNSTFTPKGDQLTIFL